MLNLMEWFDLCGLGEDERGASAIEYGLIAALVSVAGIAGLTVAGESLQLLLNGVVGVLQLPG